jgi:DASS family divalent anion:Na+ symporter
MFCGMASLSVSSALWLTATSANPIGVSLVPNRAAGQFRLLVAGRIGAGAGRDRLLPLLLYRLFPPGVTATPDAPHAAREALQEMGSLSRDERITAVVFGVMVCAWILAGPLQPQPDGGRHRRPRDLLATRVLTLEDIYLQGGTLATFLWLAVLFALSGQLNEMGFMSYVGERLASMLGDLDWPVAYVVLLLLYVLMHYMFVSQSAQVLALLGVFLDVGVQTGVPVHLMGFALLFASSYFSTLTPQGGSQNVIFRRQRLPDAGRALPAGVC